MEQPIPLAEVMTMLLFSVIWKVLRGFTGGRDVEYTGVDRVGDRVVDEFTEGQSVTTLVKELHRVCWDRETMANVIFDDSCPECEQVDEDRWKKTGAYAVDVIRKLLSLVHVDGVADVGI